MFPAPPRHWLRQHHCNYALRGVLVCLYLSGAYDFSVTGYGDILPERFEESFHQRPVEYIFVYHYMHPTPPYIVGILFPVLSPHLRRRHLLEHRVQYRCGAAS